MRKNNLLRWDSMPVLARLSHFCYEIVRHQPETMIGKKYVQLCKQVEHSYPKPIHNIWMLTVEVLLERLQIHFVPVWCTQTERMVAFAFTFSRTQKLFYSLPFVPVTKINKFSLRTLSPF